jgi:hypothetical protein
MQTPKKVYILGAGSSISHTRGKAPSIENVFVAAKQNHLLQGEKEYGALTEFIKKYFGVDIANEEKPLNVEKVLTLLRQKPRQEGIEKQLLTLLSKLFLSLKHAASKESDFVIFKGILNGSETILSFNWDLLLDDVLQRDEILRSGDHVIVEKFHYNAFYEDICAPRRSWTGSVSLRAPVTSWKKSYYLKLHGSVDWKYCANKYCNEYLGIWPCADPLESLRCQECGDPLETMLVPPTVNKNLEEFPSLKKIWNIAEQKMREADEVVVWGYRLSPTDSTSEWLLRQAREKSPALSKFIIINPEILSKNKDEINEGFAIRFLEIVRGTNPCIELYEYFRDFYEKKDVFRKYRFEDARWKDIINGYS